MTWSGLVWAWAVERCGSLIPAVLAHAAYNALFVGTAVWLYRI